MTKDRPLAHRRGGEGLRRAYSCAPALHPANQKVVIGAIRGMRCGAIPDRVRDDGAGRKRARPTGHPGRSPAVKAMLRHDTAGSTGHRSREMRPMVDQTVASAAGRLRIA